MSFQSSSTSILQYTKFDVNSPERTDMLAEHPVSVRVVMFRQDGYVLKEQVRVEKPHFGVERRS